MRKIHPHQHISKESNEQHQSFITFSPGGNASYSFLEKRERKKEENKKERMILKDKMHHC